MPLINILLLPCQLHDTSNSSPPPPGNTGLLTQLASPGGILDYWKDVTFGQYTFAVTTPGPGWVQVSFDRSQYNRDTFFKACTAAAGQQFPLINIGSFTPPPRADGTPLQPGDIRAGIIVFSDIVLDLWGTGGQAMFDPNSGFSQISHEIGHLLGLQHSQGSSIPPRSDREVVQPDTSPYFCKSSDWIQVEYGDAACIMSAMQVWTNSQGKGPTLCGPYLKLMGVIPEAKIISMPAGNSDWTSDLGPLRDSQAALPQLLRFTTPINPDVEYFIEFRLPETWDDKLPQPGLLVYQTNPWRIDGTWRAVRLYHDNSDPDANPSVPQPGQWEPPLNEGAWLTDPARGINVQAVKVDVGQRVATVRIVLGASPIPFEQRFRAVNTWATKNGFIGGYPNFHQADYGPGWTFSTLLLGSDRCEWIDVPKEQLADTTTIEGRFRSLQQYAQTASSAGTTFVGAFPTGLEADRDGTHFYGAALIRSEYATWRDIDRNDLGDIQSSEVLMQLVNNYARQNGYAGGFPTYFNAQRDGTTFFGAVLLALPNLTSIRSGDIATDDIHGTEVGYSFDLAGRLGSVQKHATDRGFLAALPTFIDIDNGRGTHFGTISFTTQQAEWLDIAGTALGPVPTSDERFRALARWATANQFVGGFPTFFEAIRNGTTDYGAILLKAPTAEGRDLLGSQLSGFNTLAERMTAVNDWAVSFGQGYVSGFPNYYDGQAQFVKALAIKPEAAVFQDLALSGATFEDRYRAANKAATDLKMGYSGAFLTGFQADYGSGLVYGCILLKQGPTEWRDVSAAELKFSAGTTQELFLAVDGWASQNGFVGGVPTLYYAGDGPSRVYGTILLSQNAATVIDVPLSALVNIGDIASYFRGVNAWATQQQFVGASPAFASDNSGPIYGAVLIHQGFGEWNDIPMAQLVFA